MSGPCARLSAAQMQCIPSSLARDGIVAASSLSARASGRQEASGASHARCLLAEGRGERRVPALLRRRRKVRFLHLSRKTGTEGRDGRGRKVPQHSLRKTAALQKLVVKPVPDSDGFQERVGRKCIQYSWEQNRSRVVVGILDQ